MTISDLPSISDFNSSITRKCSRRSVAVQREAAISRSLPRGCPCRGLLDWTVLTVAVGMAGSKKRAGGRRESRQTQTLERGASRSSSDVGHNDQFKNRDIGDFNSIFLDLAYCVKWAEIPLLAHNFSE